MLFGLHVSAAGGAQNCPQNARDLGCETYQLFSRPPQGGPAPKLTVEIINKFKAGNQKYKIPRTYIHAPYFINFASSNNRIKYGSISIVREELERASVLGVTAMMTHLGSAKELPEKTALKTVSEGLKKVLAGYKGTALFLIENSAGAGQTVGDTLEELAFFTKALRPYRAKIGICFDTCHAFATGYDLRDTKGLDKLLKEFEKKIGLSFLKLIHANDSQAALGEHRDRHEHLGDGKIGLKGFESLVKNPKLKNVDLIVETPHDRKHLDDLKILKGFRDA
ncbi:deoxyribonuclease IV [Candidatus Parcubacteria bacterium]|jgi:deoxyribonuclease-4|nr:MAG: deoxyribonuclease IV [Candidatus Parcubacteria bacterium]